MLSVLCCATVGLLLQLDECSSRRHVQDLTTQLLKPMMYKIEVSAAVCTGRRKRAVICRAFQNEGLL